MYTRRYQDIKMKWSCSFFSRFLKLYVGDTWRNSPTLLVGQQGASEQATMLLPQSWELRSFKTVRIPDALPKKPETDPRKFVKGS